jgi:hypothetical protein
LGAVNPLAPKSPLVVQCHSPNVAQKTCKSIATYIPDGRGGFSNRAQVVIAPAGPVVLITTAPVHLGDGAVCGSIRREDILQGEVVVGETTVPKDKAAEGLKQIADAFATTGLLNTEFCTHYRALANSETQIAEVSMNGKRRPDLDQPVVWLAPDTDYTVAP